jgi:hypothetical protein
MNRTRPLQALHPSAGGYGELTTADPAATEPSQHLGREAEPVGVVIDLQQLVTVQQATCLLLDPVSDLMGHAAASASVTFAIGAALAR